MGPDAAGDRAWPTRASSACSSCIAFNDVRPGRPHRPLPRGHPAAAAHDARAPSWSSLVLLVAGLLIAFDRPLRVDAGARHAGWRRRPAPRSRTGRTKAAGRRRHRSNGKAAARRRRCRRRGRASRGRRGRGVPDPGGARRPGQTGALGHGAGRRRASRVAVPSASPTSVHVRARAPGGRCRPGRRGGGRHPRYRGAGAAPALPTPSSAAARGDGSPATSRWTSPPTRDGRRRVGACRPTTCSTRAIPPAAAAGRVDLVHARNEAIIGSKLASFGIEARDHRPQRRARS